MKETSMQVCPVPKEQLPINEYQELKEAWFFSWATQGIFSYIRKLSWIWLMGWIVSGPIASASFPVSKQPLLFAVTGASGAAIFVLLAVIQIYSGWWYIDNRLKKETIPYEESGWYDGQTWKKPEDIVARDRVVSDYQIKPIIQRLQKTIYILLMWIGLAIALWFYLR